MNSKEIFKLIVSILICQGAGIVGSVFTVPSIKTWYDALNKPSFGPPNAVFGPVWVTLFLMMGISLFLIWRQGSQVPGIKVALTVFSVHLILNIIWSFLFFGLQSPRFAFIEIIVLWLAIALTIYLFYRISVISAVLLIPYILWVSFAAFLNFSIWQLNR